MSDTADLNDFEQRIVENVREHGCHVNSVFDPTEELPAFSYSVGFWETVRQPEVIITGLDSHMGLFAINQTLKQCRSGLRLFDGQEIEDLFEDFDVVCIARAVDQHYLVEEYFNSAIWYRKWRTGGPLTEALQLVWTYNDQYPWDADAPPELIEDQLLLFSGTLR